MEEKELNVNEETLEKPSATEVEEKEKSEEDKVSLGKFKDVSALLKAYNSLSSEFTKRCQKIKELEAERADKAEPVPAERTESPKEAESITLNKEEILKGYLKEILGLKSKAIVMDGSGASIKTPPVKPKTIAEAGDLAKEILNKK